MKERSSIPINDGSSQNGNGAATSDPSPQTTAEPPPRQPRAERADAFTFSAWLLEGLVGLGEEVQRNDLGLPPAFWTHAYAARRETLLAARALLDAALARCEADASRQDEKTGNQRGRVDIDFN